MGQHYFEDFEPGQVFCSKNTFVVEAQHIKDFAAMYDPQPFHMDEEAAEKSFFQGLAASGWMTAALTMKLNTSK